MGGNSFGGAEEREHGPLILGAGFFHECATAGDETKTVLDREGTGSGVGGKFAEGETGGSGEGKVRIFFPKDGEEGESVEVEGGLAVGGAGKRFFGSIF